MGEACSSNDEKFHHASSNNSAMRNEQEKTKQKEITCVMALDGAGYSIPMATGSQEKARAGQRASG